jgi:ethanolamine ammonia-lyase small subunit
MTRAPALRDFTAARVSLGRAGDSVPTEPLLDLRLAHARARDAVHTELNTRSLRAELAEAGMESIAVRSEVQNRMEYLRRPDLGRRLNLASQDILASRAGTFEIVPVIADGLSATAVHRHAIPVLTLAMRGWFDFDFRVAPVVVAEGARVAIGDDIGAAMGAKLSVVLIGERPGLSAPDSLGIYLTWRPRRGRNDAERNCISNVRPEGLSYERAATLLLFLCREALRRELSGVALKPDLAHISGGSTGHVLR